MISTHAKAMAMALLAAFAWGAGNVSEKTILDHLDCFSALGITSLIGALVLAPLARREGRQAPPVQRDTLPLLVGVALLFTLASAIVQFSYALTTVTHVGFLGNADAVLTPMLAWLLMSQRPAPAIWPASVLALLGVFLMAGGRISGLGPGDLLALLSALGYSVWALAVGLYVTRTRRPVLMTAVQLAVCGVLCTGLGAIVYGPPTHEALTLALPEILFLGLVSNCLAFVLMAMAQQHISATSVGVLASAEAVFGALIAALLLGERLDNLGLAGCMCIIFGVVIAARIPAPAHQSGFSAPVPQP
jgi:drug/metabolite transporter (DMT)-like permease